MNTCAIIVTFNRLELLKESIQDVLNQSESVEHLVIIDNDSTDGTREYLDGIQSDQIIVYHSSENMGGAGGFNRGLKIAYQQTDDEYFWIMDDDTIVGEESNERFKQHADDLNNEFGFLCSNVRWKDGSPTNVPMVSDDWPAKAKMNLVKVDYGSFVSFFLNRKVVAEVGLPIADFFLWFDDNDYSIRLREVYPGYFMNDVLVTHKSATNKVATGLIDDSEDRIDRYYYFYRNLLYLWKVHFPNEYRQVLIRKFLKSFLIVFQAKSHRFRRQRVAFKGIIAATKFSPKIERLD